MTFVFNKVKEGKKKLAYPVYPSLDSAPFTGIYYKKERSASAILSVSQFCTADTAGGETTMGLKVRVEYW